METLVPFPPLPLGFHATTLNSESCGDGFAGLTAADQARRAEILHRAHSIWESKGRGPDHQLADWLEAEAEVLAES